MSVKFTNVEPSTLAAGGRTYFFLLDITTGAKSTVLRARYSAFRAVALAVQAQQPKKAALLPPFPTKSSLSRQTPKFLTNRGKALACYVQALLADEALASVLEVQTLLAGGTPPAAELLRTSRGESMYTSMSTEPSISSRVALVESPLVPAARELTGAPLDEYRLSLLGAASPLQCFSAMLVSLLLGLFRGETLLALSSCVLGLLAGELLGRGEQPRAALPAPPAEGVSSGAKRLGHGTPDASEPAALTLAESPSPPSVAASAAPAASAPPVDEVPTAETGSQKDGKDALAIAAAREALQTLAETFASPEALGWKPHSTREGVQILTRVAEAGVTWGMGIGSVAAPPGVVFAVQSDDATQRTLDKQFAGSVVVHSVAPHLLQLDGWVVIELDLVQQQYKSPAWPVGPREMCGVKVVARRTSDGALRVALRSVDVPGCRVPAGHTRTHLTCGGYEAVPDGADGTSMKYVNMVDPKGNVPSSVVKVTVPDRAMVIARIRKACENKALWRLSPEWARLP